MNIERTDAWILERPARWLVPLVVASPHSGRLYPREFLDESPLPIEALRSSEDAHVDSLVSFLPGMGVPLLAARFPRAFVDVNRARDELDPRAVAGLAPSRPVTPRAVAGLGVIPRVVSGGREIRRSPISAAEAERRLRSCWDPWHARLGALLEEGLRRFGEVLLVDMHSMPRDAVLGRAGSGPLPEIVVGDRYGASLSAGMRARLREAFGNFRLAFNRPFAGAHTLQAYGDPASGRQAVQLEVDRALYLDRSGLRPGPGFEATQARLREAFARLVHALGRGRPGLEAAE